MCTSSFFRNKTELLIYEIPNEENINIIAENKRKKYNLSCEHIVTYKIIFWRGN